MNKHKHIKPNKEIASKLDAPDDHDPKQLDNDFISRKKELILLDYQTLFDVYGREFTVIYSFRGWAVTLLTAYFGLLFTVKPINNPLINLPGIFIIISFYILEIAERSVMRRLLKEVRYIESIFMIQSSKDFRREITKYEFRDLRDVKIPLKKKVGDFLLSIFHLQVVAWHLFLLVAYYILTNILPILNASQNIILK